MAHTITADQIAQIISQDPEMEYVEGNDSFDIDPARDNHGHTEVYVTLNPYLYTEADRDRIEAEVAALLGVEPTSDDLYVKFSQGCECPEGWEGE